MLPLLGLGGVTIGMPIVQVVQRFGTPQSVRTTSEGHVWEWTAADELDREVTTGDSMMVEQVLVANAAGQRGSPRQPAEHPVLGMGSAEAENATDAAGGVALRPPTAEERAWIFGEGVLVERIDRDAVVALTAMDRATALRRGYLWPSPSRVEYRPPALIEQYNTEYLPPESGTTILRLAIDAHARVTDVGVLISSGHKDIDDWAIDEAMHSKFSAAQRAGIPCAGIYVDVDGIYR